MFCIIILEIKAILSGHVNYKEPMPSIKVEKNLEDEYVCDFRIECYIIILF